MAHFLLLIEKIIDYSKSDIDKGNTPSEIYRLCSCIRETFCISYTIRKGHILFLLFENELILIKLIGSELRFLGSDERSQALLLGKALDKIKQIGVDKYERWIESTPGIYAMKFLDLKSLINYSNIIIDDNPFLIIDEVSAINGIFNTSPIKLKDIEKLDENFYLIPTYSLDVRNSFIIQLIKELENIKLIDLSKIKAVEDKILYINFQIDHNFLGKA